MNIFAKHEVQYILSKKRSIKRFLLDESETNTKLRSQSPAFSDERFLQIIQRKKMNRSENCEWAIEPLEIDQHTTKNKRWVKGVWKATR